MKANQKEGGFTYIDVMIGVTILLVGVMALAAAVTAAVIRTREGGQQLIAKQLAASTLESIFAARDISTLGWNAVGNVGSNQVNGVPQGRFLVGQQPIRPDAGADGVAGTIDDAGAPLQQFNGYQRQIVITDYEDPERRLVDGFPILTRRIQVRVFYNVGNVQRQEVASTMIANYAVE